MTSTMKAIRLHGKKDLRLDEIPIPEVKDGQVKVTKRPHSEPSVRKRGNESR